MNFLFSFHSEFLAPILGGDCTGVWLAVEVDEDERSAGCVQSGRLTPPSCCNQGTIALRSPPCALCNGLRRCDCSFPDFNAADHINNFSEKQTGKHLVKPQEPAPPPYAFIATEGTLGLASSNLAQLYPSTCSKSTTNWRQTGIPPPHHRLRLAAGDTLGVPCD